MANCKIARERSRKIGDCSSGGVKRPNRPGSAVDRAGERSGRAIQQAAEGSAGDRRRAGGKRLDRSVGNVGGGGGSGSGGQSRDGSDGNAGRAGGKVRDRAGRDRGIGGNKSSSGRCAVGNVVDIGVGVGADRKRILEQLVDCDRPGRVASGQIRIGNQKLVGGTDRCKVGLVCDKRLVDVQPIDKVMQAGSRYDSVGGEGLGAIEFNSHIKP